MSGERSLLAHLCTVSELPVASVSDELSRAFLSLATIMDCALDRFLIFFFCSFLKGRRGVVALFLEVRGERESSCEAQIHTQNCLRSSRLPVRQEFLLSPVFRQVNSSLERLHDLLKTG